MILIQRDSLIHCRLLLCKAAEASLSAVLKLPAPRPQVLKPQEPPRPQLTSKAIR